jgi:hypothetical protein
MKLKLYDYNNIKEINKKHQLLTCDKNMCLEVLLNSVE